MLEQPSDLTSTVEVHQRYVHFYNFERPNQAITYANQPPRVKFPQTPKLSPVPLTIDLDRWVLTLTGKTYKRKLDRNGCFQLGKQTYYVQKKLQGHGVIVWVDGQRRELAIFVNQALIKRLPIKGLQNPLMNFPEYLELMCKEAVSAWRRTFRRTHFSAGHDVYFHSHYSHFPGRERSFTSVSLSTFERDARFSRCSREAKGESVFQCEQHKWHL